jgi:hypothetical protein
MLLAYQGQTCNSVQTYALPSGWEEVVNGAAISGFPWLMTSFDAFSMSSLLFLKGVWRFFLHLQKYNY